MAPLSAVSAVKFAIVLRMVYEPPVVLTVRCAEHAEKEGLNNLWIDGFAEPKTESMDRTTVLQHVHSVDIYQKRRVDVPRFELGASTMPR